MKHFDKYKGGDDTNKLLGSLLSPSWLSGLVAVTFALILIILTIFSVYYQGSGLQNEIATIQNQRLEAAAASYTGVENPTHGRLIEDLPLIAFWSLVGLMVYMFIINIVTGLQELKDLRESLDYVNANPHKALVEAGERLAIRAVVLAIWLPYILAFFHHIVPYCITIAQAAADGTVNFSTAGCGLLALLVASGAVHVHVILLRLLLLKPRALSSVNYDNA